MKKPRWIKWMDLQLFGEEKPPPCQRCFALTEALKKAGGPGYEIISSVIGSDQVAQAVVEAANTFLKNRYRDEEVKSTFSYPDNYTPNTLDEQIRIIAERFRVDGSRAMSFSRNLPDMPEGAESWFVIPRWQTVAPTYFEALWKVIRAFSPHREFSYWHDFSDPGKLDSIEKAQELFSELSSRQHGDIIIFPAQFGLRHRGRSVRRTREKMRRDEFGLGAFAVLSMVMANSDRVKEFDQLHIDCPGDGISLGAGFWHTLAPLLSFESGRINLGSRRTCEPNEKYGSATGFLF